jgi:WD40 repeat protein/serine/threonine protein kinase
VSTSPCPACSQLADLIAGRLSLEWHETIEEHLRSCANCQAQVAALDEPDDDFVSKLNTWLDATGIRATRPLRDALAGVLSLHHGAPPIVNAPDETGSTRTAAPPFAALTDFRFIRELGRGGMGIVYEAEQLSLGRRVALKILPFSAMLDPRQLQRFQNEARAAACLEHPNIVSVYSVGMERGVHFYAMRLIEGRNLAQVSERLRQYTQQPSFASADKPSRPDSIATNGSALSDLLSTASPTNAAYHRAVARIGAQAAGALQAAHEHGIVHRDIKPSNLMLDHAGCLWVADFGLARIETAPTISMSGGVLGTVRYMSPEQALGRCEAIDHRSDVYSLGVTLYELLTLTPIFPDADRQILLGRIATDEPQPPRRLNAQIPVDLETIVVKAMAKNSMDRYATAGAMAADLRRFLEGQPILARPVGSATRAWKWARRRPALAALLGVSVVAVLLLLIGGWWHAATLQVALTAAQRLQLEADTQRQAAGNQSRIAAGRERQVRQFLYAADMRLASVSWKNSQISDTVSYLERHLPKPAEDDLRSFVWFYLWGQCHGELMSLRGHQGEVYCIAYSPNAKILATGGEDRTVKLWDASTGQNLSTLAHPASEVDALAFSPDGKTLATAGEDAVIRLWDIEAMRVRATLTGHRGVVRALAFAPDGNKLASGGEDRIARLWDLKTGRMAAKLEGHQGRIYSVAFSPNGLLLATASGDTTAKIWDVHTGHVCTTFKGHAWTDGSRYQCFVNGIAFSHDGRRVASAADDRTIKIWDPVTGASETTLRGQPDVAQCVAFSPDDQTLAAALNDGNLRTWETATGKVRIIIRGHTKRIWSLAYSSDGRRLATAGADGTARIWDADANPRKAISDLPSPISALSFSPDGSRLAAAGPPGELSDLKCCFRVWDTRTLNEEVILRRDGQTDGVAFAANGKSAVSGYPRQNPVRHAMKIRYATSYEWGFRQVNLQLRPDGQTFRRTRMILSHDGGLLATAANKGSIGLWEPDSGKHRLTMASELGEDITALTFTPDSKIIAAGRSDGTFKLWETTSGSELASVKGHRKGVLGISFANDGQTMATASGDYTVKLWDVAAAAPRGTLRGHRGPVRAVVFSPDAKVLASGSDDGTVRLWDVRTFQELISLDAQQGRVLAVAFSSDGTLLVSGGATRNEKGEIFLWQAAEQQRTANSRR